MDLQQRLEELQQRSASEPKLETETAAEILKELRAGFEELLAAKEELRRQSEALAARSHDFPLALFDDFPSLIWRSGVDAKCDYFNRTWLEFTGRTLQQELGDGWAANVHPEDVGQCLHSYLASFHARQPFELEYRLRRHDGAYRWMADYGSPFHDLDGQFAGYIGSCYDITEHKEAEAALHESESRFQAFMDNSPAMVIVKDAQGRYVYFNKTTERLVQATLDELRGKTNFDRLPDETARQLRKNDLEVLSTGQAKEFVESVATPDGQIHHWLASKFPIPESTSQRLLGVVAFDITERKEVEAALRESEERFAKVFHSSPVTIGITTVAEGRFVDVNESLLRLYGYKREEVIGHTAAELKMWEGQGEQTAMRQKLLEQGTLHDVEHTFRVKSGELRDGITSLELLEIQGEPCILALTRDVTERKRVGQALQQERDLMSALIETVGSLVVVLDRQGRIIRFNRACEQLSGYSFDEVKGKYLPELFLAPEEAETVKAVFEDICTGQFPNTHENYWVAKDGSRRLIAWSNTALLNAAGEAEYVIGTGLDITERQRMEEELRGNQTLLAEAEQLVHLGSWNWDIVTNTMTGSDELYRIFDLTPQEFGVTYEAFLERVHPDDRDLARAHLAKTLQHNDPYDHYFRIIRPSGAVRTIHSKGAVVMDAAGHPSRMFGTVQDVTEQKQADEDRARLFEQVRVGRDQLQNLSQRLIEVQETERRHLAHELHDEIGQALTAVQIDLQTLQYRPEAQPIAARLEESISLVDRALHQVRDLSLDLRPSLLDDFGLVVALRWYVERQAQRADFTAHFVADPEEIRLPPHVEIACFRVVQEALTNVLRHAQAHNVHVELRRRGEEIQLLVHDDGTGFDVRSAQGAAARGASLGLLGMQERVHLTGGRIEIESTPARGTEIRACFPLQTDQPLERRTSGSGILDENHSCFAGGKSLSRAHRDSRPAGASHGNRSGRRSR